MGMYFRYTPEKKGLATQVLFLEIVENETIE